MTTTKETLVDWLKDAHAMENSIVTLLEKQVKSLDKYPTMQGRVKEHLEITRTQKDKVKGLIDNLGGDVSVVKEATGKLLTNMQGMITSAAPDDVVKSAIGNFAVEHFEIASYRSLIAAADQLNMPEVSRVCREILEQEEEMAEFLSMQIADVTKEYLGKQVTAK